MEIFAIIVGIMIILVVLGMYRTRVYQLTAYAKAEKDAGTSAFAEFPEDLKEPYRLEVAMYSARLFDNNGNVTKYKTTGYIENYSDGKSSNYINEHGSILITESPSLQGNALIVTCLLYDSQNNFLGSYSGGSIV